ncbi:MAG: hypothetical protein JOY70_04320 [Acidisphaera sp.]|nr:hypothetical protein [Acidisphaera sp.]MBV9813065.1 hypothetical protein [Acetobacteraceae bacterium]
MTAWLAGLCDALSLQMRLVADTSALVDALGQVRPVGLLCGDFGAGGAPVTRLLRLIAGYDPTLPVLLVTTDDPETLGSIDAAVDLWPLENMEHAALPVPVSTVLDFIARAGQQRGGLNFMRA